MLASYVGVDHSLLIEKMCQKSVFMAFIPSRNQALESLHPDMSTPTGDSDALQARVPWIESQQKLPTGFPTPSWLQAPVTRLLVAANKPANSRLGAESQLEMALFDEMLRVNPVVAEPLW
jgi:hypothetical protein